MRHARVLVVDDEAANRTLIRRVLTPLGLEIQEAADGEEAVALVTARAPDLILLDLKLPKLSGIEVLRKLKGDPVLKKVPVVVLTSSREEPDVKTCYELGVNSYIAKPVDFDPFANVVAQLGMYWLLVNEPPRLE